MTTDSDRTVGDTAPPLEGTVSGNLTGAGVEVHIKRPDRTVISRVPTITAPPTGGDWVLDLIAGDLTIPGNYYVEVEVTYSDASIETFYGDDTGLAMFPVRAQIA